MIEDKAKDLGRLIGQSSEYQAVKRRERHTQRGQGTVALLQKMEQLRRRAAHDAAGRAAERRDGAPARRAAWRGPGSSMHQRLLVAQENFDKIMGRVNDWILEGIEKGATSSIITLG